MTHEIIDTLLKHWRHYFFMEPVLILAFISCFMISLFRHKKETARIVFVFYFFIGTMLTAVANSIDIFHIFSGKKSVIFFEVANTSFELAEFMAFYYFFKKCLHNKIAKKISKMFLFMLCLIIALFFAAMFFPAYSIDNIRRHSVMINVIEFLFLAILCLYYFYELFTSAPRLNLFERPSFLIVTSAFFYSVLMIPFFSVFRDLLKTDKTFCYTLFSCHYILLTILLVTITKAFLDKLPITT